MNEAKSSKEVIERLQIRVKKLENLLDQKSKSRNLNYTRAPGGPIRSVTFRMGTKDDRLRIYWADGSKSDLPCLKEQSIWVCG